MNEAAAIGAYAHKGEAEILSYPCPSLCAMDPAPGSHQRDAHVFLPQRKFLAAKDLQQGQPDNRDGDPWTFR
jgi:hypothetical protein